eukprot:gene10593-7359_t
MIFSRDSCLLIPPLPLELLQMVTIPWIRLLCGVAGVVILYYFLSRTKDMIGIDGVLAPSLSVYKDFPLGLQATTTMILIENHEYERIESRTKTRLRSCSVAFGTLAFVCVRDEFHFHLAPLWPLLLFPGPLVSPYSKRRRSTCFISHHSQLQRLRTRVDFVFVCLRCHSVEWKTCVFSQTTENNGGNIMLRYSVVPTAESLLSTTDPLQIFSLQFVFIVIIIYFLLSTVNYFAFTQDLPLSGPPSPLFVFVCVPLLIISRLQKLLFLSASLFDVIILFYHLYLNAPTSHSFLSGLTHIVNCSPSALYNRGGGGAQEREAVRLLNPCFLQRTHTKEKNDKKIKPTRNKPLVLWYTFVLYLGSNRGDWMASLSKRDVSNVEKLIEVIEAVLQAATQEEGGDCGYGMAQRRLWSELGCVLWRIAALQKLYLLSYIAEDPLDTLATLFRHLVESLKGFIEPVRKRERLDLLAKLHADRLLYLLSLFSQRSLCTTMLGEPDGPALHEANCEHLAKHRHLQWMAEAYVNFCEEVHRRQDVPGALLPSAYTKATEEILVALRHCCESDSCSRELLNSEPTPCVTALLYGVRLRLSAGRSLGAVLEDDEAPNKDGEDGAEEAQQQTSDFFAGCTSSSAASAPSIAPGASLRGTVPPTLLQPVSPSSNAPCRSLLPLLQPTRRKQRTTISRYFSGTSWRFLVVPPDPQSSSTGLNNTINNNSLGPPRMNRATPSSVRSPLTTSRLRAEDDPSSGPASSAFAGIDPPANATMGIPPAAATGTVTSSSRGSRGTSVLRVVLDRCRCSVYSHVLAIALDVVVEAVRVQQTFDHWTLLPTLSSFTLLCAKFLSEDTLTHDQVVEDSQAWWRLLGKPSVEPRSPMLKQDLEAAEEQGGELEATVQACDHAVAMYENMVLMVQMISALAASIRPADLQHVAAGVGKAAGARKCSEPVSAPSAADGSGLKTAVAEKGRGNAFFRLRGAAVAPPTPATTPPTPTPNEVALTPEAARASLTYLRDRFFTEILRCSLPQHIQQVLRTAHPILAVDPYCGLMRTVRQLSTLGSQRARPTLATLLRGQPTTGLSGGPAPLTPSSAEPLARQRPSNTSMRLDGTSRAVQELKESFGFSGSPATSTANLYRRDPSSVVGTDPSDVDLPPLGDRPPSSVAQCADEGSWLEVPSYVHVVQLVVDLFLEVSGNENTTNIGSSISSSPEGGGGGGGVMWQLPGCAKGLAVANADLTIRLGALLEVCEITLSTEAVFETYSGRLTVAAVLHTLVRELSRSLGPQSTRLSRSTEDPLGLSGASTTAAQSPPLPPHASTNLDGGCHSPTTQPPPPCAERYTYQELIHTLAMLCCCALERVYYDNGIFPIASETERITELPLLFCSSPVTASTSPMAADLVPRLEVLFTRVVDLWRLSLEAAVDEDMDARAMQVFYLLCQRFNELQHMPKDTPGFVSTARARQVVPTTQSLYCSFQFAPGSAVGDVEGGMGVAPSGSSFAGIRTDSIEIDCVQESGRTTDILKATFLILLEHEPQLCNAEMCRVLLQLLRSSHLNLSRLGRLCVRASLLWRESHAAYANCLRQSTCARTVTQLLHLLARHLTADDVTEDTLFERRISLLQEGCVTAAVDVLVSIIDAVQTRPGDDRAAGLLVDDALCQTYVTQVPVIFRFLAAFEPSQHRPPHLMETDFVPRVTAGLVKMAGVQHHWLLVECAIHAALGKVSVPPATTPSTSAAVRGRYHDPVDGVDSAVHNKDDGQPAAPSEEERAEQQLREFVQRRRLELKDGSCVADKAIFLDFIPPCASYLKVHCPPLYAHLVNEVLQKLFCATGCISSPTLVDFVVRNSLTHLIPRLALPHAVVRSLPFKGPSKAMQDYWVPALLNAPLRSHIRFVEQGGVCVNLAHLPPKGITVSAVMRFDAIYPTMPLMELRAVGKTETSFSVVVIDGDTMQLVHEQDRSRTTTLNDKRGLLHFLPGMWIQVCMVFTITRTVSMFLNGVKVGGASVPYFIPSAGLVLNVGFVENAIPNSAFAISEITVYAEELTWRQVEAAMAGVDRAAAQDIKVHLREVHMMEDPAIGSGSGMGSTALLSDSVINPIDDRVAHFMAHENDNELLHNVVETTKPHPMMAKIVGRHATPPQCWVDFHLMWVSRGGLLHLLEWVRGATTSDELKKLMTVFCRSIRHVSTLIAMDPRIYLLFGQHLHHCGALFTNEVASKLLEAAATSPTRVDGRGKSSIIVNRLILLHILCDPKFYVALPVEVAIYTLERLRDWFNPDVCAFAPRNVIFADPVVFVDRLLQAVVQMSPVCPLRLLYAALHCAKQVLIVSYNNPSVIDLFTSLAAILTPEEAHHTPSLLEDPASRVRYPRCSAACQVKLPLRVQRHLSYMLLVMLIECRLPTAFRCALGPCVSLEWYVTCLSSFALPASVLCATRLYLDAARHSSRVQKELEDHQLTIVEALRPHAWCEDVPLLLLAVSIGAHDRVELLSGRLPLLVQMCRHHHWNTTPDVIGVTVASICLKVLVFYLQSIVDAEGVLPNLGRHASLAHLFEDNMGADPDHYGTHMNAVPATAATAVSFYMQQPRVSYRLRRVVSLARSCARLMVILQKQRYKGTAEPQSKRNGTPPPPMEGGAAQATLAWRRRPGMGLLRVAVLLWIPIQKKRYKIYLPSSSRPPRTCSASAGTARQAASAGAPSPSGGRKDRGAGDRMLRQMVRCFYEITAQPRYHNIFVSTPLQSAALSSLFSLVSEQRLDAVVAHFDKKMLALVAGVSLAEEHEAPLPTVSLLLSDHEDRVESELPSQDSSPVVRMAHSPDSPRFPSQLLGMSPPPPPSPLSLGVSHHSGATLPLSPQTRSSNGSSASLRSPNGEERHVRSSSLLPTPETSAALFEHTERSPTLPRQPEHTEGDAAAPGAADEADEADEAIPLSIVNDRSLINLGSWKKMRQAMGEQTRREAVRILSTLIEVSLCVEPPATINPLFLPVASHRGSAAATEWVGGKRYGACGGLLLQMLAIASSTAPSWEGPGNMIRYFFFKVASYIQQVLPAEGLQQPNTQRELHPDSAFSPTAQLRRHTSGNGSPLSGSISDTDSTTTTTVVVEFKQHKAAFLSNISKLTLLVSSMISVNAVTLPQVRALFLSLIGSSATWGDKEKAEELHRTVICTCIASIRKPFAEMTDGLEKLDTIHTLTSFTLRIGTIAPPLLECFLVALQLLYESPCTAWVTPEVCDARNVLITKLYRCLLKAYVAPTVEEQKQPGLFPRRPRNPHKSLLLEALSLIFDREADDVAACRLLQKFYAENTALVENFKNSKGKGWADSFIKEENAARKEYVAHIRHFNTQYAQIVTEREVQDLHELRNDYVHRFSSYTDAPPNLSEDDGCMWLALPYAAAGFELSAETQRYHCLDRYSGYGAVEATMVPMHAAAADGPAGLAPAAPHFDADDDIPFSVSSPTGAGGAASPPATRVGTEDVMRMFLHDPHMTHVRVLGPALATRCRPYLLVQPPPQSPAAGGKGAAPKPTAVPPFIHPSLSFLTPSAWTMVRHVLHPKDQLRYIGNCFHVTGLCVTPCLVLLTGTQLLLLSYSRLTDDGNIILFEREERYQFARSTNSSVADLQTTRRSTGSLGGQYAPASSQPPPQPQQQQHGGDKATSAFSLAAVTRHIHRFLVEDSGRDRKRQEQLHRDGTKVAQAVRQTTRHTYRQLYWSYHVAALRKVLCLRYMHVETAVHLQMHLGDGPMLALMDQHESMNPNARSEFLNALKGVLKNARQEEVEFHEESQRPSKLRSMLIRWATGSLSSMEYLRFLNAAAGRTTKDLNQHPVFPWVLADYTSAALDFEKEGTFRNLGYPIGAQTEAIRAQLAEHYEHSKEITLTDDGVSHPFHHGIHYSTSGGLLYYLLRAEPFTTFSRLYQGGDLDRPSRLFHSIAETYHSCVYVSSDTKELVPAFYENADFLLNADKIQFGVREDGVPVDDVVLPPWAKGSTQVFSAVMRYALESDYVLNHVHEWIDLVFGIRRRGPLAVERCNVFQRMTYGEAMVEALNQASSRQECDVIISEVDNFGQAPRQLFTERHPAHCELAPTTPAPTLAGGSAPGPGGKLTYKEVFDREAPHVLQMLIHCLSDEPSAHSVMIEAGFRSGSVVCRLPEMLASDFATQTAVIGFTPHHRSLIAGLPLGGGSGGTSGPSGASGDLMGSFAMQGHLAQPPLSSAATLFLPSCKGCTAVEQTDYYIAWHAGESCLMRFHAVTGAFISMLPFYPPEESGVRITALAATCRETMVLMGTSAGSVYVLFPDATGRAPYLHAVHTAHRTPVVAVVVDSRHGRAVTLGTDDDPAVWRVAHCHLSLLARLPVREVLREWANGAALSLEDRMVRHACIDPKQRNIVLVTRRHVLIFDSSCRLYGQGALPAQHAGPGPSSRSSGTLDPAPMNAVALYDTSEWANGMQLLVVGHVDGTLSLWRVTRLPPAALKEGAIVMVQFHASVKEQQPPEEEETSSDSSDNDTDWMELRRRQQMREQEQEQIQHRGAVTALHQVHPGVPHFLIGYQSGLVRSWRFGTRPDQAPAGALAEAAWCGGCLKHVVALGPTCNKTLKKREREKQKRNFIYSVSYGGRDNTLTNGLSFHVFPAASLHPEHHRRCKILVIAGTNTFPKASNLFHLLTPYFYTEEWAQWVRAEVLEARLAGSVGLESDASIASVAMVSEEQWEKALDEEQRSCIGEEGAVGPTAIFFVVAVFWDAFQAKSKLAYARLKDRTTVPEEGTPSASTPHAALQLLNSKRGVANWRQNPDAVVRSFLKTLSAVAGPSLETAPPPDETATGSAGRPPGEAPTAATHRDPRASTSLATTEGPATRIGLGPSDAGGRLTPEGVAAALDEGSNECFFSLSADTTPALEAQCRALLDICGAVGAGCTLVGASVEVSASLRAQLGVPVGETGAVIAAAAGGGEGEGGSHGAARAECLLRRRHATLDDIIELRLSMCGNVDSGKSTLTSVLTRGCRDDGRGFARAFVFRHRHEQDTGRTSSVSEHYLGFSATGEVLNFDGGDAEGAAVEGGTPSNGATETFLRHYRPQELSQQSDKIVTLYDLAGHEKYLKTTVLGMTRNIPDYACVVVSANNGIQRMTREHLILCLALRLPFFIALTRVDATPQNVRTETMASITKMIKSKMVQRKPFLLKSRADVVVAAKHLQHLALVPIIEMSSVTGEGLPLLTYLLHLLPQRHRWSDARKKPKEMVIDNTYFVAGVGTVVGGIVTQGIFHVNDVVLLGPDGCGHFRPASIKSIHVRGNNVIRVEAGNDAAFCLKKEKRSAIRKGNVLLDAGKGLPPPKAYWRFEAEVTILYHATTISVHYEPVIHASTVLQCARITSVDKEVLRTGDRALVRFHFLYRPEYLREGQRIIFREGRTKGIGVVTHLFEDGDVSSLDRSQSYWKRLAMHPPTEAKGHHTQLNKRWPSGMKRGDGLKCVKETRAEETKRSTGVSAEAEQQIMTHLFFFFKNPPSFSTNTLWADVKAKYFHFVSLPLSLSLSLSLSLHFIFLLLLLLLLFFDIGKCSFPLPS